MKYAYWLNRMYLSNQTKWNLLQAFGSAEKVYGATEQELIDTSLLDEKKRNRFLQERETFQLDIEYEKLQEKGIGFVYRTMKDFPKILYNYANCPFGLYYRGHLPDRELIAMVGARRCSQYGKLTAQEISQSLIKHGFGIVSGMARGIDGISQRTAVLGGGYTIAVLGSGVDVCYPPEHKNLYADIVKTGCVLSEFHPGTNPLKEHFPARNRLISGLSRSVVVVEAREKSGSLITADFALEQGKDIFAVPGRITDVMSKGCNQLIKTGAMPIVSVDQLIMDLSEFAFQTEVNFTNPMEQTLEKENLLVYSCLDFYAIGLEQIMSRTNLDLLTTLSSITELEEAGLIKEVFKNQYIRLT